jgi:hypothetical protein
MLFPIFALNQKGNMINRRKRWQILFAHREVKASRSLRGQDALKSAKSVMFRFCPIICAK